MNTYGMSKEAIKFAEEEAYKNVQHHAKNCKQIRTVNGIETQVDVCSTEGGVYCEEYLHLKQEWMSIPYISRA